MAELEKTENTDISRNIPIGSHGPQKDTWTVPAVLPILQGCILICGTAFSADIRVPPRHAGRGALSRYSTIDNHHHSGKGRPLSPATELTVDVANTLLRPRMSAMLGLLAFPSRGLPVSAVSDFLLCPPASRFNSACTEA